MYVVVAGGARLIKYMILCFSAFALFLWGSGLRMFNTYYPNDPQWMMVLLGIAAFVLVVWFCRPDMPWVIAAEEQVTEKI
jgi:hypothetical protein